ncbi:hypothetical protein B0H34DRAFT_849557 [Crassisporium funariophilum]|nr:hypothetical protein B0H34DRAFT_849557 [Crassisporium funariophilum]
MHRRGAACLRLRRSQGLPDLDPLVKSIPILLVTAPDNLSETGRQIPCPGQPVEWLPGSIWETYPYYQHNMRAVGWRPIAFNHEENEIVIRSDNCLGFILDTDEPPCKECWSIVFSNQFQEFLLRAKEAKQHTPWELLTAQQMCSLLKKMANTINSLRTQVSNSSVSNHNNHTRMVMLLGTNDIPGLRRLIAAALRRGISARGLVLRLEQAIAGAYSPRGGFNQREHDIAFLVQAIAGPRLLYALNKSHGFASTSTVQRNTKIPRLLPSVGIPSAEEMRENMSAFLNPSIKPRPPSLPSGKIAGNILMFDGVALESKCRYCRRRDSAIGICREHAKNVNPRITSFASIAKLRTALFDEEDDDKKACFGSDATVVAMASYARSDHYRPIPLIVSPSDKTEKGEWLALWIQTLIDEYSVHIYGSIMHGPIFSIGSDGDSSFRKARQIICIKVEIDRNSELGKIVCSLLGINVWTSPEGITGTCDPKHVFKRFATLLQNPQGFLVHDTLVTATDIVQHLAALPDMSVEDASSLLTPTDRQNVPKAVSLIQHLQLVQGLPAPLHPGGQNSRDKVNFMSKMLGHFVLPFITIEMSLSQQLESLSTFSHLAVAMFIIHGVACLTGALYADAQSIVKNLFLTVARLQITDLTLNFYILMEGTDRLENLFCECRTQDHSRNFDIEQLGQKLSVATLINAAFERNPDLNRGHRKLNLQGTMGVDRINPESWKGDTCVGNVDLRTQWDSGRERALTILGDFFGPNFAPDLAEVFSKPKQDILRPMGDYVGIKATPDDARSEEEVIPPAVLPDTQTNQPSQNTVVEVPQETVTHAVPPDEINDEDGETFENLATIVAFAADIDTSDATLSFEDDELEISGIELDDLFPETLAEDQLEDEEEPEVFSDKLVDGDKEYLKSALIAALRPDHWKRLTVRPFRVQGKTLESLYHKSRSSITVESVISAKELNTKDIVAFLVHSANGFCLVVMEVIGFRYKKEKSLKLAMGVEHLTNGKGDFKVSGQIMEFSPCLDVADAWDWTKRYVHLDVTSRTERLTQAQFILEVPVSLVYPVGGVPVRTEDPAPQSSGDLTWRVNKTDLEEILNSAWDSLNGEGDDILGNLPLIPKIVNPNVVPYKDASGNRALMVENVPTHLQIKEKLSGKTVVACHLCGETAPLSKMRGHIGALPCGFCGLDSTCQTQLAMKKSGGTSISSTCSYHYEKMQYKAAQDPTKTSPCTNVPIHCQLCPPLGISGEPRTIWKYNAMYHLLSEHPADGIFGSDSTLLPKIPGAMMVDMFISLKEENFLKVAEAATLKNRQTYTLPGSDDIEAIKEDMKRERAPTVSVVEPTGKRRR